MTVTYLKDGRIEVKDSHDARLLSMAGVDITHKGRVYYLGEEEWTVKHKNEEEKKRSHQRDYMGGVSLPKKLHVPADVTRGLVWVTPSGRAIWNAGKHQLIKKIMDDLDVFRDDEVHLIRHNDRWNLLPDIEMEK